ncbi:hypothetical protein M0R45_034315 [Rubus argutus]|uniref:WRC domain-containing protein n=1 Tax=Rubus argutus TaxID=59490 RepID=A0AAW1VS72_RUBAR
MVRIRKNLKVSPLQFCSNVAPEDLQPHICKLNQSPWDLNPLPLDSSPHQFEAEEWFNGNVSLGNSIVAVESVASPMDIDKAEWAAVHADIDNVDKGILRCQKNDGRSWQCKKEAKEGFLFCEHHIRRSYNCNNNVTSNGNIPSDSLLSKKTMAAPAKALSGTRRARPKAVRKGASSANPYEYYYYSGFGPKWGRKRGKKDEEEEEEEETKIEAAAENDGTSSSTSTENIDPQPSPPHNVDNGDQLDYMEDDFEDEDEDGSGEEGGRRRMRRPVKARSLMSIINVQAKE